MIYPATNALLYSNSATGSEWVFYKDGVEIRKRVHGRFNANNGTHQKTLALNHHGIVRLPDFIGQEALDRGDLVEVLGDYDKISTDIQVVFPEKKNMRAVLRAFIEHLAD